MKGCYRLLTTEEYREWYEKQSFKDKLQVQYRLSRLQDFGHFGDCKSVGNHVVELRWKNGRRLYFAYVESAKILILLGGSKNGQKKDVKKAQKLFQEYCEG